MPKKKIISPEIQSLAKATSNNEIHSINVVLRESTLSDLPIEKKDLDKITWSLSPRIFSNFLFSELKVRVINIISKDPFFAQELTFSIIGKFTKDDDVSNESFAEFARDYSLSVLWPYAREYANNIFLRTGFDCDLLPIINPQAATQAMIEAGKIEVVVNDRKSQH